MKTKKHRTEGYYWVYYQEEWVVANWSKADYGYIWFLPGFAGGSDDDSQFDKINEKKITEPASPYER